MRNALDQAQKQREQRSAASTKLNLSRSVCMCGKHYKGRHNLTKEGK